MNKDNPMFKEGTVSILIPTYNEGAFLRRCLERVLKAPLPSQLKKEIIIVDDGSTDGSRALIQELTGQYPDTIKMFTQSKNLGKGAAIRRAIHEMTGEFAIFQDADLEYDPNEYSILLEPILKGVADVVYGSRFASRKMRRVFNYHHALGNRLLTHLSNLTTGLDLTDMETCYKVFRSDILKTIPIRSEKFGIEPEITAKIAKRGCLVYEVPISYYGRDYLEGKKIGWKDGVEAIFCILKYSLIDDCFSEEYGHAALHSLSGARQLNNWMLRAIQPYLGNKIIEIGSGIGNLSRHLPRREQLTLSELEPKYLKILTQAFHHHEEVQIEKLDLTKDSDFDNEHLEENYDTVICMNVLEHIQDDTAAIKRIARLLKPGGCIVTLVPQHEWLFSNLDKKVGHCRRYNKKILTSRFNDAGLTSERIFNFNSLGILGWFINAKLLGRTKFNKFQLKMFDSLVPIISRIEAILPLPGLSIIGIGRKEK